MEKLLFSQTIEKHYTNCFVCIYWLNCHKWICFDLIPPFFSVECQLLRRRRMLKIQMEELAASWQLFKTFNSCLHKELCERSWVIKKYWTNTYLVMSVMFSSYNFSTSNCQLLFYFSEKSKMFLIHRLYMNQQNLFSCQFWSLLRYGAQKIISFNWQMSAIIFILA